MLITHTCRAVLGAAALQDHWRGTFLTLDTPFPVINHGECIPDTQVAAVFALTSQTGLFCVQNGSNSMTVLDVQLLTRRGTKNHRIFGVGRDPLGSSKSNPGYVEQVMLIFPSTCFLLSSKMLPLSQEQLFFVRFCNFISLWCFVLFF